MPKPRPQRIGPVVQDVLRLVGERHSALAAIQRDWGKLVGKGLAAHTQPVSLRRGRLTVHADRPGNSFALSYQHPQLLERLRDAAPGKVEELVIRPGDIRKA